MARKRARDAVSPNPIPVSQSQTRLSAQNQQKQNQSSAHTSPYNQNRTLAHIANLSNDPNASQASSSRLRSLPPGLSSGERLSWHTVDSERLPPTFSLNELFHCPLDDINWIVPDLLPGGVSLLAGPARVDKALLANQLGLCVATGTPFLDRFPVTQGRVLYLALSADFRRVRGRAARLLREQTNVEDFTVALDWLPFRNGGLADLEDTLVWMSECQHSAPRLIIVDPLQYVHPLPQMQNPQNYRVRHAVVPAGEPGFFLPLRQLATRYNLAILLLHDLADDWIAQRRDPLFGLTSTGLTPASACNMLLSPDDVGHVSCKYTLHLAGESVDEQRLAVSFDSHANRWYCVEESS